MMLTDRIAQRQLIVSMLREAGLTEEQALAIVSAISMLKDDKPTFPGFMVKKFLKH